MQLSVPYSEKINKILTFNTQRQIKGRKYLKSIAPNERSSYRIHLIPSEIIYGLKVIDIVQV